MTETREARMDFPNPLLINEVAERVLQFVPVAHLKSCRLVCSLWWKESLARWRRTHWLKLSCYDLYHSGRRDYREEEREVELTLEEIRMKFSLHIDLYISIWEDPLDPYKLRTQPFQNLKLFKSRLAFDSGENDKLERFFAESGPPIKSLVVEKCTFESLEDFRKIVFRFSPNLEYLSLASNLYKGKRPQQNQLSNLNLKTLVAKESDVQSQLKYLKLSMPTHDTITDEVAPLTWTEFFAHIPNIQSLEFVNLCINGDDECGEDYVPILKSINALKRDCGILQTISGLDILNLAELSYYSFELELMDLLCSISLPLTFLACDIGYHHDNGLADPGEFLEIAPVTLETLVIYKGPFSAPFGSFPYGNSFPNLTKLTLVGPIVNDLSFLEQIPTLKILRLFQKTNYEDQEAAIPRPKVIEQLHKFKKEDDDYIEDERVAGVPVIRNTNFLEMAHLTFPNIEEFLVGEESCTGSQVEQLARLMPNMKRLRLGLNNGGFRAVCKFWKGLEALDVIPAHVNEAGVTGIVPGEDKRLPNITDLKYLKIFGMSCETPLDSEFSDLTDSSFEQGLLELKYLERLVVWCSWDKMSNENYKKLKSMFPPYPYSVIKRLEVPWFS